MVTAPTMQPGRIKAVSLSDAAAARWNNAAVELNTLEMVRALVDTPPVSDEQMSRFKQLIADGLIDTNADVGTKRRSTGNNYAYTPLAEFLLRHGDWGAEEVYPLVLDRLADLNTQDEPWHWLLAKAIHVQNINYVSALLNHPAVDVNKQILDDGYTVLEECTRVIDDEGSPFHSYQGKWRVEEARHFLSLLLDRGAILHEVGWDSSKPFHPRKEWLKPYIAAWEKEWDDFSSGRFPAAQLTQVQLGHFYSLGHVREALDPVLWTGHEEQALRMYDALPQWVREREPCEDARRVLLQRLVPDTVVEGWSVATQLPVASSLKAQAR